jgi:hypothetical protein
MAPIPETALRARQMYIDGKTVKAILADTKFNLDQLYHWLDGGPQSDGATLLPPIPRRRVVKRKPSFAETRLALVMRIMQAAAFQISEVEQRQAGENKEPADRESDARRLAIAAKTLRDLMVFDTQNPSVKKPGKPAKAHDDFVPRNVDELRRELARRVDLLRQRRAAGGAVGGT